MNQPTAHRLIRKLRALAADHAATPGEAAVATAKADRLVAKHGEPEVVRAPKTKRRVWTAQPVRFDAGVDWKFDYDTGIGSDNVKVHHHHGPSNWKIEIDLSRPVPYLGRQRKTMNR